MNFSQPIYRARLWLIFLPRSLRNQIPMEPPVSSQLNTSVWRHYLTDYVDHVVVDFLQFGWPINYMSSVLPQPTHTNHQSALSYPEDVQHYLSTELSFGALAGPFKENPLPDDLITSLLQTVYKRGSTKRRVMMGLTFPHAASVNSGIPKTHYLDNTFQLRLPGIDRLREFIISKAQVVTFTRKI